MVNLERPARLDHEGFESLRLTLAGAHAAIPNDADVVVSLAPEARSATGVEEHTWHFPDSRFVPIDREQLLRTTALVANAAQAGEHLVVRCRAGLNRSALVLGVSLARLGFRPELILDAVRSARGVLALCNPYYEDTLMRWPFDPMRGPLPLPADVDHSLLAAEADASWPPTRFAITTTGAGQGSLVWTGPPYVASVHSRMGTTLMDAGLVCRRRPETNHAG